MKFKSLHNNRSGIEFVPEWAELGFKSCVAGTIKGLDVDEVRNKLGLKSRYMDYVSFIFYFISD